MQISDRIKSIKPSLTLAMNAKALELKEQGVMVTSLAVGEPDFPTPKHICEAAKAAIDSNFCRYTAVPGIMELRKAVCGYYSNQYDLTIGPENVIISNGGKQALYNYIMCTVNPGDEVIIPAPYWVSYPAIVELAGGVPVYVEAGPEDGFKVTPDKIRKAITPKTKLFILNSPCNPTGAVYSAEELKGIMDVVIGAGLNVFSDEVYDQLVFAPAEMASASPYFAKYPEQVSILCGLSKSFAMTGWRVGFLVAHKDIIKKCSTLQGQSTSNICSIAQKAALAARPVPWTACGRCAKPSAAAATWPCPSSIRGNSRSARIPTVRSIFSSTCTSALAGRCTIPWNSPGICWKGCTSPPRPAWLSAMTTASVCPTPCPTTP